MSQESFKGVSMNFQMCIKGFSRQCQDWKVFGGSLFQRSFKGISKIGRYLEELVSKEL